MGTRIRRIGATFALVAAIGLAGATPALAVRDVQMGANCGTIVVTNATQNWTLKLFSSTFEGNYSWRFPGTGTITIAGIRPGGYGWQFFAPNGAGRRSGSVIVGC